MLEAKEDMAKTAKPLLAQIKKFYNPPLAEDRDCKCSHTHVIHC